LGGGAGERDKGFGDGLMESRPVEEVARWVARERELGCHDEVCSGGAGEVERSEDAGGVFGEVSDPRIELRCEDLQG
jgi:hypothetical protein